MTTLDASFGLSGHFSLSVYKLKDNSLVRKIEFDNLILNSGLNRLALDNSTAVIPTAMIGTGTTTPAVTDTGLASFSAATSTYQTYSRPKNTTTVPHYFAHKLTYRFNAGQLNGNYSEVGVGWSTSSGGLFSRALIVDGTGNPTTITVLSDEFLDVTYELRFIIPDTVTTSSVSITGLPSVTSCQIQPYNAVVTVSTGNLTGDKNYPGYAIGWQTTAWTGVTHFNAILTSYPSTGIVGYFLNRDTLFNYLTDYGGNTSGWNSSSSTSKSTYITDTYYRDYTVTFGLNNGNGSFRTMMLLFEMFCFQILFDAPIVKNNTQTLVINFRLSWGRYTP